MPRYLNPIDGTYHDTDLPPIVVPVVKLVRSPGRASWDVPGVAAFPGRGGGGAGGTIKIFASVLHADQATVDTSGGSPNGGTGRYLIGSNTEVVVGAVTGAVQETFAGPREANPLIAGSPETPFIPNLLDGADIFGITTLTRGDITQLTNAPANAEAALLLLAAGPPGLDASFDGFDLLLLANLTNSALTLPRLGVGQAGLLVPLQTGGTASNPQFGGSGRQTLDALPGNAVYALLVPAGGGPFNAAVTASSGTEEALGVSLSPGTPVYLGSDAPSLPPPGLDGPLFELGYNLTPGWSLVGWLGNTPVEEASADILDSFDSIFTWDPSADEFLSYRPSAPAFLNTLDEISQGDAVFIFVTEPSGTFWPQPDFAAPRTVALADGFNLVLWTGPSGTPIEDAIESIIDQVNAVFAWDRVTQSFLTFRPGAPAFLNTATTIDFGEGVWVDMSAPATWEQPSR